MTDENQKKTSGHAASLATAHTADAGPLVLHASGVPSPQPGNIKCRLFVYRLHEASPIGDVA